MVVCGLCFWVVDVGDFWVGMVGKVFGLRYGYGD